MISKVVFLESPTEKIYLILSTPCLNIDFQCFIPILILLFPTKNNKQLSSKKPKLLHILAALDESEHKSLKKYLLRYTGKDSDNMLLISYLYKRRKKITELTLKEIHDKQFPKMSVKAVQNLFSRVNLWTEEWLSINEMQNEKYSSDIFLLNAYNRMGLYNLADQLANRLQNEIQSNKLICPSKTKTLKEIAHTQYYSSNPNRDVDLMKQLCNNHLLNYKEQSLIYHIELHSVNTKYENSLEKEIALLESSIAVIHDTELSHCLKLCKQQLIDKDADAFFELKSKLDTIEKGTELYILMITYIRLGFRELWSDNLIDDRGIYSELADIILDSKNINKKEYISTLTFHNILTGVAYYSNYELTTEFIDKWIDKVNTKDKESTRQVAIAIQCFYFEEYDKINSLLSNVSYESVEQKTRGLAMQAIGLYKTQEYDILHSHNISLRKIINRNKSKMRKSYYESILNLLKVIDLLCKRQFGTNIKIDLKNYSPLFYKSWCLKNV